jgi:tungstate transport system ATP-binding protein
MMNDAVLAARGLQRSYGDKRVIDVDVLHVHAGEIIALLGENGAGKSTLFRLLLQLEQPDAGTVSVRGTTAGVFQKPYLFDGTVNENIEYGLRVRGLLTSAERKRIRDVAASFGLAGILDKRVHQLSGGEVRRTALLRALVLQPDVLLLDEPTANLDAPIKRQLRDDLLRAVRTHARSVLIITHDPADAFGFADRIAVLEKGRIVQDGAPEDVLANPASPFVASFAGAELLLGGSVVTVAEDLVHVSLDDGSTIWATLPARRVWPVQRSDKVHIAYRPEDVVLSSVESTTELSARNQFRLRVAAITGSGGLVRLRLEGKPTLSALITRTSCESLGLRPGRDVIAHLKAAALRAFLA